MSLYTGVASIIHEAPDADTTGFTYSKVYAGVAAAPVINGVAVTMAAGSTIEITIRTISATADVFVLGHKTQVFTANPTLGGLTT